MISVGDSTGLAQAGATTVRHLIRTRQWTKPTAGVARGFVQANLVALPRALAYGFLLFAVRNPRPLPLLDVADPGTAIPTCAPTADLRNDLPPFVDSGTVTFVTDRAPSDIDPANDEVAGSDVIARSILAAIKDALVSICQFYVAYNHEEGEGAHDASGEDSAAS